MTDSEKNDNIFMIMDGIISQLNKTKKFFLIMVFSILIIPPAALLLSVSVLDNPFRPDEELVQIREEFKDLNQKYRALFSGVEKLPPDQQAKKISEIINSQEFADISKKLDNLSKDNRVKPPERFEGLHIRPLQLSILVISLVWVGIGIKQYISISKWSKRYEKYKKLKDDIDKKLGDENSKNDQQQ
ncbi:MAG TPA: hypothetical protein VLD38_01005 [Nitrosopumilaceae archaeon]|nr:hypothetical protein [Nitrosopumilaceae archaeon]